MDIPQGITRSIQATTEARQELRRAQVIGVAVRPSRDRLRPTEPTPPVGGGRRETFPVMIPTHDELLLPPPPLPFIGEPQAGLIRPRPIRAITAVRPGGMPGANPEYPYRG